MTADLAAWLLADDGPIAEDERRARVDIDRRRYFGYTTGWDPARVLAECAAKRQAIELAATLAEAEARHHLEGIGPELLLALAQPYAGCPGWNDEWASPAG